MYGLDFHADDYAASAENSRRILSLAQTGRIDSFSVITNMGCFEECMALLRESWDSLPRKPLLSVHLNLIDGFRLSPENSGLMRHSWAQIFFRNFVPGSGRRAMFSVFSSEIEAQIRTFLDATRGLTDNRGEPVALRIDSHVHTHMIPLVFRALLDALDRMGLRQQVQFIRCSTEPLSVFFFTPGVTGTVSPVNLVKNLVLRLLSRSVRNKLRSSGIGTGRVFGIAMTGEMDLKRVQLLLPKMKRYARNKDAYLEVLSHPGRTLPSEISEEYGPDDRKAFLSPHRDVEYEMLFGLTPDDRA